MCGPRHMGLVSCKYWRPNPLRRGEGNTLIARKPQLRQGDVWQARGAPSGLSDRHVRKVAIGTGEALPTPGRNLRSKVGPISDALVKWAEGGRVADWFVVPLIRRRGVSGTELPRREGARPLSVPRRR